LTENFSVLLFKKYAGFVFHLCFWLLISSGLWWWFRRWWWCWWRRGKSKVQSCGEL